MRPIVVKSHFIIPTVYDLNREIGKAAALFLAGGTGERARDEVGSAVNRDGLALWESGGEAAVSQSRWTQAGTRERGKTAAPQSLALAVGTWEARRRHSLTRGTWWRRQAISIGLV